MKYDSLHNRNVNKNERTNEGKGLCRKQRQGRKLSEEKVGGKGGEGTEATRKGSIGTAASLKD